MIYGNQTVRDGVLQNASHRQSPELVLVHVRLTPSAADPAPVDGFLIMGREKYPAAFVGDLPAAQAGFMAGAQVPWA